MKKLIKNVFDKKNRIINITFKVDIRLAKWPQPSTSTFISFMAKGPPNEKGFDPVVAIIELPSDCNFKAKQIFQRAVKLLGVPS